MYFFAELTLFTLNVIGQLIQPISLIFCIFSLFTFLTAAAATANIILHVNTSYLFITILLFLNSIFVTLLKPFFFLALARVFNFLTDSFLIAVKLFVIFSNVPVTPIIVTRYPKLVYQIPVCDILFLLYLLYLSYDLWHSAISEIQSLSYISISTLSMIKYTIIYISNNKQPFSFIINSHITKYVIVIICNKNRHYKLNLTLYLSYISPQIFSISIC